MLITSKMVENMECTGGSRSSDKLSKRQRQCVELVGDAFTSKQIGRLLSISPSTVDNHIQTACDKLGARNRTDAVRIYRAQTPSQNTLLQVQKLGFFSFPPIGGKENDLPKSQRLFHIVQIAVFAVIGVSAAILSIAGVVHILVGPE